jgi:small-conductance mechanosensitive channel
VILHRVLLVALIIGLVSPIAWSQARLQPSANLAQGATSGHRVGEPVPLVFWNREITIFRSYYEQTSPAERARGAAARLAALPQAPSNLDIVANEIESGGYSGVIITVNGSFAFVILAEDLDPESGETVKSVAAQATTNLRAALDARAAQWRFPVLVRGIVLSIAATLVLLLGLWLVLRGSQSVLKRIDRAVAGSRHLKLGGFDLQPLVQGINRGLVRLSVWATAIGLVYVWLAFVLVRFPYSQPWGKQLGAFLLSLFEMLGTGVVHSIPRVFTVVVIFLLTRIVARVVNGIFREVEKGELKFFWIHSDTARATRRLVTVLVWIFAVTVAYPYIPGSNTDAFKGVSVFVGLMVSLGSAGLVNQVMSGLVVAYSRALRPGEFVSIGDDLGTVSEVGMLSTKIITRKREEITIPNAVLVGTRTVNYSRHAAGPGVSVGTTVTIGYDAPWRQVHAMLLHAADQTPGVRKDPAPRVWQKALSDFYVEYELVVNVDHPEERTPILSELHMHIQDAFNEQGVQIMSPHFEGQPNERVFVPKSAWFGGPLAPSAKQNGGEHVPTVGQDHRDD